MFKTFIREIRQNLADEPAKLNKINSYWNNAQRIIPTQLSEFLKDEINSDSNESITYSLLASYNYLMNRLGDKVLSDDANNRLGFFETEMKELIAPDLVEEPCHSLSLEGDKVANRIRKQAILVDAANHLAHVASEFSTSTSRTLMVEKDMLMSRLITTCMLYGKSNPDIAYGVTKDKDNKDVMIVNAPYVGQVSWHLGDNNGRMRLDQYVNGDIHDFLRKRNKDTDKKYGVPNFSGRVANISPRNNFSKLLNDVDIFTPDRIIGEPDKTLRRNLKMIREGRFTEDGKKVYRLEVSGSINK